MWASTPAFASGLLTRCSGMLSRLQMQSAASASCLTSACQASVGGTASATSHCSATASATLPPAVAWGRPISTSSLAAFASPKEAFEAFECRLDKWQARVERLEAVEAARSALCRLLTWLDAAKQDPSIVTPAAVGELFTPSAVLQAGTYGSAESLEEVVPLLQKIAKAGGSGRQHTTNIVADPSRDDTSIVRATAYSMVVEPVAGAKPVVSAMYTLNARLERGLDDKWRIRHISFVEVVGST